MRRAPSRRCASHCANAAALKQFLWSVCIRHLCGFPCSALAFCLFRACLGCASASPRMRTWCHYKRTSSQESNAPSTVAAPRPPPPSVVLDDSPASGVTATGSRRAPVRDHLAQQQKTLKPTRRDGALLYGVPAAAPTVSDSSSSSSAPASSSSSLTRINPPGWSETAPPEVKTARPAAEWAGWSQVELTRPAARPVQHDPDSTAAPRRDIRTATSSDATPTRARGARSVPLAASRTHNERSLPVASVCRALVAES